MGGVESKDLRKEEAMLLGRDFTISEEDLSLWIEKSKDKVQWFEEEPRDLREKLKFIYKRVSQRLIYYGPKHKKPNTTKGPLKPKHRDYKIIKSSYSIIWS